VIGLSHGGRENSGEFDRYEAQREVVACIRFKGAIKMEISQTQQKKKLDL
jgi:hypothetical protein